MVTALIDIESMIYKALHRTQYEVNVGENELTYKVNKKLTQKEIDIKITDAVNAVKVDQCLLFFGSNTNFRKAVYPPYKANRDIRKPLGYYKLKKYLIDTYASVEIEDLEADDTVGLWATNDFLIGPNEDKIVISEDKDFFSVECRLFNPEKPDLGIRTIPFDLAKRNHLVQTMVGDATDNYPGIKGVGVVGANKILDKSCSWRSVRKEFENKKCGAGFALKMARMAKILQRNDYNFETKKINLWRPS